ncbi:HAD-IIIC family phosphatase [Metabacillus arenae]|uniref:HAD-IIIC family phosphatase n=1 Tax=Metabacillus arenae TaxID=2771434 RepID=A0A926RXJ2_9BACI|nr:HAD-IIIC family phosphatase [Metabacillus arenae]MBD1381933.1 HAD-IIIC family phosphatase [Metabacillus arenae]
MNEHFDYPLDTAYLLRKKRSLKKELLKKDHFIHKKIAVLGGSTTAEIKEMLELFLLNEEIKPQFYESDYNKYFEEIMFSDELKAFNPDIIFIHTSFKNILNSPEIHDDNKQIQDKLEKEFDHYKSLWEKAISDHNCIVIQNNFEYPRNRSLGNLDTVNYNGLTYFINKLNLMFSEYIQDNPQVLINDINYLSSWIGLDKWHDMSFWYHFKYSLSHHAIPYLAKNLSIIIRSVFGKSKKCLVLDLDNTLWGGIIGDDGVDQIKIGKETALAEGYTGFQKYIKELTHRGITLAIASKNEYENAIEGLNHPEMTLNKENFSCIKANWEPKFINIDKIAQEINIGIDSLVFIDDNPAERDIVKSQLPLVAVPNIGEDAAKFIDYIDRNGYFEPIKISKEDMYRNKYYEANKKRETEKAKFNNYNEFLQSLNMIAEINSFQSIYLERIAQLTNKTNQFNLTTRRYSPSEIEQISNSKSKVTLYGRLKDKYGDNGLISVVIGDIRGKDLHIDLWLMSCRVLKRDMEKAMFDAIVEESKKREIKKIYGYYYKTAKNNMVIDHYQKLGFEAVEEAEDRSKWVIEVSNVKEKKNKFIARGKYE